MDFRELLLWLPQQLQNFVLWATEWGRNHIARTLRLLGVALAINVGLLGLGILMETTGFRWEWAGLLNFGHFLTALSGALAACLWLLVWVRIWVLGEGVVYTNQIISEGIRIASRPLPSEPIQLKQFVQEAQASKLMRFLMGGLAGVATASVYAAWVPVYTNVTGFLVCITAGLAITFAYYNMADVKPENSKHAMKWLAGFAGLVLVVNTLTFFLPYEAGRIVAVRAATGRAYAQAAEAEVVLIRRLGDERAAIISHGPALSDADIARLSEINALIQDISEGKYTGSWIHEGKTWLRQADNMQPDLSWWAFAGGMLLLIAVLATRNRFTRKVSWLPFLIGVAVLYFGVFLPLERERRAEQAKPVPLNITIVRPRPAVPAPAMPVLIPPAPTPTPAAAATAVATVIILPPTPAPRIIATIKGEADYHPRIIKTIKGQGGYH